ncbi:metal ABC transporter solute-binding protein, Zn/Mn family [Poseidonibacter ostreae]|uniref:Cation ABC transporter substrate-binding protein n=1 Tax=Poseidonibacter ostreae TaxID=2654171 RepID=A0A6L4WQQ7_9BACT|nr:zinc ABC transporter substrate-binding protein [Poseidonibacter ostreae]KAB7886987.1 cation ABC transporter substrate-binding protein [Poseidonibacter ostreae]KAB7889318.1 cation ABC transporter substrate-binding protein [Poseidonibacter ostreae]
MKRLLVIALLMISSLSAQIKDVTVSIVPQKYFVEKIAGDKINVNVMVKKGFSPANYEPKTSQMKKLAQSSIYFSIGVPFENSWLKKFKNANKNMLMVDTSMGIEKLEMVEHSHHEDEGHHDEHADHDEHDDHKKHDEHDEHKDHDHEKHDEHDEHADHDEHESSDPHIWNDPILVKIQAKNIYEALVKVDHDNESFYKENYEKFIKELDLLNQKLETILNPYKNKAFMVFHPSWGYFAKKYSLEQVAIESQGKEPKPKELVELIKDAKEHNIKIVFVAPQFSQKSAKLIANSINGSVHVIDPLAKNWEENLIQTAEKIANTYK